MIYPTSPAASRVKPFYFSGIAFVDSVSGLIVYPPVLVVEHVWSFRNDYVSKEYIIPFSLDPLITRLTPRVETHAARLSIMTSPQRLRLGQDQLISVMEQLNKPLMLVRFPPLTVKVGVRTGLRRRVVVHPSPPPGFLVALTVCWFCLYGRILSDTHTDENQCNYG